MSFNIQKYKEIQDFLNIQKSTAKIIAVSKTRSFDDVNEAYSAGIRNFGEIKVQEAIEKFDKFKSGKNLNLHMIGSLQSNKVKKALTIFNFFHSLDRESLAIEFSKFSDKLVDKFFFVQVNTGHEKQKSGINPKHTNSFVQHCLHDLNLNVIGLMCLPPINQNPKDHFMMLKDLTLKNKLKHLSIGMSGDYAEAIKCGSTYIRIGTGFFGLRK